MGNVLPLGTCAAILLLSAPAAADFEYGSMVIDSNGRILLAATDVETTKTSVIRFEKNGIIDKSFGIAGVATMPVSGYVGDALAVQPDGKILVGAEHWLVRLEVDGQLDLAFGQNGQLKPHGLTEIAGIAVQPDGRIVLSGIGYRDDPNDEVYFYAALTRLLSTGAADLSFGGGLVELFGNDATVFFKSLQLLPGGQIAASGGVSTPAGWDAFHARVDENGAFDAGFAAGGVLLLPQGNGEYRWGGFRYLDDMRLLLLVEKLKGGALHTGVELRAVDGSIDPAFNFGQPLLSDYESSDYAEVISIARMPDGTFVAGAADENQGLCLFAFDEQGQFVTGFGENGHASATFDSGVRAGTERLLLDSGGGLVGSGSCFDGSVGDETSCMMRFSAKGEVDTSFADNGRWYLQ